MSLSCSPVFVSALSGVWAEERDPQAAGVQKSRDQVLLQWVRSDLFIHIIIIIIIIMH